MRKIAMLLLLCLTTVFGFAQSLPKYQAATVVDVVPVQSAEDGSEATPVYHVSLKVKDTVYVVRYNALPGAAPVKYSAGTQILVLVGDETIKYNDLLGRSFEVPIVKKMPATKSQQK